MIRARKTGLNPFFSPAGILLTVLAIVFAAETAIMFLLPELSLPLGQTARAVADSCLLTVVTAPLLWWVIIGPLRRMAMSERARAAQLAQSTAEGIVTIDSNGTVLSFNRAAELIFGYRASEMLGQNVTKLMPPQMAKHHEAGLRRYLQTGQHYLLGCSVRMWGQHKDGSRVPVELSISQSGGGRHPMFIGVVRDLTDRMRFEAELKAWAAQQAVVAELGQRALAGTELIDLLRQVVARTAQTLAVDFSAVLELQPDGDSLLLRAGVGWQQGLVGQLRCSAKAAASRRLHLLGDEPVVVKDLRLCADTDSSLAWLLDHGAVSGASVVVRGHDSPFGALAVFSRQPRTYTEETVHFLQAIANVVSTAIERQWSEQQRRQRDMLRAEKMAAVAQVATGVAHELRNPLTSIKLLVQSNRAEVAARGLPTEDLQIIEQEIRRMERALNTVLDFARPAKPRLQPVDLAAVVQRTLTLLEARAAGQRVQLRFTPPARHLMVQADWEQIQQLLLNLGLNALDAMDQGGELVFELQAGDGQMAELRVADSGPGIAPHVLPQLFEPFVTTKDTGVGLGLVISRRIAEDHGGSLSAFNRSQGGACFVLQLPVAAGSGATAGQPATP